MEMEKLISVDETRSLLKSGKSHRDISVLLQSRYGSNYGVSERSVRRFCDKYNIHRRTRDELDAEVSKAVSEVGPSYGRKTMSGLHRARGIREGRYRIQESLKRVNPTYHNRRRNDTVRQLNPVPYFLPYHGHKLHVDQNEKLVYFGVTHVLFSDGYSRKIVADVTMPVKNPIIIYNAYRDLMLKEGLWDMVRVDMGREFCLVLFIQSYLKQYRTNKICPPYIQSRSANNLPAERKWPEVNQRFNYVIKGALIEMQRRMLVNMMDDTHKFCVSFISCAVADVGMKRMVAAWNHHPLEGMHFFIN